jgi:putative hydrolase of the HAD superfamily
MTASNPFRIILFDLGGVLVELTGAPKLLSWIDNHLRPENLSEMWLASPSVRSFETGQISPDQFANQLIAELSLPVAAEAFLREFVRLPKGLFEGVHSLLDRIQSPYIRATLSNNNVLHWPRLMNEMRLQDAFDHHFPSHLTGRIKPDAEAFEHVIETLGCAASTILFLDDNALNVESAKRLGMKAEQVNGVQGAERALLHYGVISTIHL